MTNTNFKCRFCESSTFPIIDFGDMPIANYFRTPDAPSPSIFRLATYLCKSCFLFQLEYQPQLSEMFNDEYPFYTGLSQVMRDHFQIMVNDILDIEVAQSRRFVVEIGCNDGTALGFIKREGIRHLGIDASRNVIEVAERNGINVINSFFSNTLAQELIQTFGTASHVFAANVICHIPDLHDLASGIKTLLQDDGVFVFEEPYLCDMLRKFSYDQIYDEHIYMFSLYSITNVFSKYGLFLFDAEPQETHGGSMRYFLSKGNSRKITNRLKQLIEQEEEFGVTNPENYDSFVSTCLKNREDLVSLLVSLKEAGKTVAGYAATSKSTTVLNFCGIGPDLIQVIYDSTPDKIGCVTPGSNIPIESQNVLWKEPPDYLVLFAWNHKMEIMMKERDRLPKGQKWILFVPRVEIFSE